MLIIPGIIELIKLLEILTLFKLGFYEYTVDFT